MASNTSPLGATRRQPSSRLPWVIGAVGLLAGGALFYFLNYTHPDAPIDAPLTVEGKAYVRNLKLSDVTMKATSAYFGQKIVEIEGKGSTLLKAGEAGIISAELVHLARNESASANGKALVVHSRAAKDKPLIVVVRR